MSLEERQKEILNLKQTISDMVAKEEAQSIKLESMDTKHREEISRILER